MKQAPKKISRPSLVWATGCCVLCLVCAVVFAAFIPFIIPKYLSAREPALLPHTVFIEGCLYAALAVAVSVMLLLLRLLGVIRRHEVFTSISSRLIAAIGWLVILEGVVFGVLTAVYLPAIGVPFVAVTLGLSLLVVSGVLKEATDIKAENDQTI